MAQADWGSRGEQYPANTVGTLGEHSFIGLARIHLGTGGMPVPTRQNPTGVPTGLRTQYGFQGLAATYVGTGLIDVSHPSVNIASVFPQYVGLSGHVGNITPQWSPGNSASGVVRLQLSTQNVPTGAAVQSGALRPLFNAPSGTRLDLLFYANPNNDQSITQY